jgi:hypothetical protein
VQALSSSFPSSLDWNVAGGDLDRDNAAPIILIYFAAISESALFGALCIQGADHDYLTGELLRCFRMAEFVGVLRS